MTSATSSLPELTFELAQEIGEFEAFEYVVDEDQVRRYEEVTGDSSPLYRQWVPPGFAGIFGRRSYLEHHRMPRGGVLLRQEIVWHAPASVGSPMMVQATVVEARESEGRRSLTFQTVARQGDTHVATVMLTAGWPR